MNIYHRIKQTLQKTVWPYGSVGKIVRGHLKGYKFIITENSGWSPIFGRWEPESHELFKHLVQKGQTVFDLGANNGIHSLLFSHLTGPSGKIYVFEPLPENIDEIKKNCSLNQVGNITIVEAAVGNHDGTVKFFLGLLNKQGSIAGIGRESGKEVEVKLISLKSFINNGNIKPDFIKIDIEGAESDALAGMGELIGSLQPVFFIELHTPEQDRKVGDIFMNQNYTLFRQVSDRNKQELGIPYLEKISDLSLIYPHPKGIWGTIIAIPNNHSFFSKS